MDKLREADAIVDSLGQAMQSGETGLRYVPALLLRVINEDMWQERVIVKTGERATFKRFVDFVTTQPLEGLGADEHILRRLCAGNSEASAALEAALTERPGAPEGNKNASKTIDNNVNNCFEDERDSPVGNSAAYALRKLRSDAPELHERVIAGDLSPHAAMVEAGFRRKTLQIPADVDGAARTLCRKFTIEELHRLVELLADRIAVDV